MSSLLTTTFITVNIDSKAIGFNPAGYLTKGGKHYTMIQAVAFVKLNAAFNAWYTKMVDQFGDGVQTVNVIEIYPFVNETKGIGFVMVDSLVQRPDGSFIPGFVFIRGGSVAIFTILENDETGQRYVLNTVQARVPGASPEYEEIPAGMIDGKQNFGGVAATEMAEETGLVIHLTDLEPLGLIYPSIGGCDEFIQLYRVIKRMPADEIAALENKLTGNVKENEVIRLQLRTEADFVDAIKRGQITDAKAVSALAYHMLK